ncbi:hypothetical protein AL346_10530 [Chelatococcus sp. CO-6]|nr:hypothetical protein AL346_10530 [Chelatococcus sp. CO-6]
MATVTSMHEEVHAAADKQEQERPGSQKVNPVLENKKDAADGEKHADRKSGRCFQKRLAPIFVCLWLGG